MGTRGRGGRVALRGDFLTVERWLEALNKVTMRAVRIRKKMNLETARTITEKNRKCIRWFDLIVKP